MSTYKNLDFSRVTPLTLFLTFEEELMQMDSPVVTFRVNTIRGIMMQDFVNIPSTLNYRMEASAGLQSALEDSKEWCEDVTYQVELSIDGILGDGFSVTMGLINGRIDF